jgi:UTP-glucose-1-phosphate uridylyltransferase
VIKKCLFPAAGYGTRFLPATKSMPKEMMPVVNKPLIEYGVEEAVFVKLVVAINLFYTFNFNPITSRI